MLFLCGLVVTYFVMARPGKAVATPKGLGLRQPSIDDIIYEEGVLFQVPVPSRLECALMCLECGTCEAFTTSREKSTSAVMTCRGYRLEMTSPMLNVTHPGSRTYYMKRTRSASVWLQSPCNEDTDCAVDPNSKCFRGQCLCTPGYFFSYCRDRCVSNCSLVDLQQTFVRYPKCFINNFDLQVIRKCPSMDECRVRCLNNSRCRTFDYSLSHTKCWLAYVTARDARITCNKNARSDHYQRTCV